MRGLISNVAHAPIWGMDGRQYQSTIASVISATHQVAESTACLESAMTHFLDQFSPSPIPETELAVICQQYTNAVTDYNYD